MLDPYETERKLLAISSPLGLPPQGYKLCHECGQPTLRAGQKRKHEEDYRHARGCPNDDYRPSETMRLVNALGDLLARECPLSVLLGAVRETEND